MRALLTALILSLLPVGSAGAQDTGFSDVWSEPNPGLRYLRRTRSAPVPAVVHVLVVDLGHEGVRIEATPHDLRWRSVSDYARERDLTAAINGGFWSGFARPEGVQVSGGELWPGASDDEEFGFFAVGSDGRAFISTPEEIRGARNIREAVSGRPMLVAGGRVDHRSLEEIDWSGVRAPRTAVGVSRDGRTVYLVVADGRQGHSRGMSLYDLAEMFVELGAHAAINLDGGGSSAMYVQRMRGIVSSPSGGRWQVGLGIGAERTDGNAKRRTLRDGSEQVFVRGIEREVMNHIGVHAPDPVVSIPAPVSPLDEPPPEEPVVVLQPRPPLVQLGTFRELLMPALWIGAGALPALVGLVWWRRRRRKAARAEGAGALSPGARTASGPAG